MELFVLLGIFEPIRLFEDEPALWSDVLAEVCGFEVGWIKPVAAMGLSAIGLIPRGRGDAEDMSVEDIDVFDA